MGHIINAGDLTVEEMAALRLVVEHSFLNKTALNTTMRKRLAGLGLILDQMGGVMPTPAGRIAARG